MARPGNDSYRNVSRDRTVTATGTYGETGKQQLQERIARPGSDSYSNVWRDSSVTTTGTYGETGQ